jgi:hypothetical protein
MKTFTEWLRENTQYASSDDYESFDPNSIKELLLSGELDRTKAYTALIQHGVHDDDAEHMIAQWLTQAASSERPERPKDTGLGIPHGFGDDHHSYDRVPSDYMAKSKLQRSGYGAASTPNPYIGGKTKDPVGIGNSRADRHGRHSTPWMKHNYRGDHGDGRI